MKQRNAILLAVMTAILGLVLGSFFGSDSTPAPGQTEHAEHAEDQVFTCSMHPQVQSDGPGQCPICGMDLVPLSEGSRSSQSPTTVTLSKRAKTLAKVRTTEVKKLGDAATELRLLGRVEQDETRVRTVTAWTSGRIDRLHVATTGQKVRAGQTIATIYSPEIYTAHRDLLQAKRQLDSLSDGMGFARSSAQATLESARQKLRLLGVSNQEIAAMEKEDEPRTQVRIRTRFGGTVIERIVDEGSYVQPGSGIYRVSDLSKLWVQLDAYESDLPHLRLGQHVSLSIDAVPGEVFEGKIAFIDPVVDAARRTAQVRVELENDGRLSPGMYAEATVAGGLPEGAEAPLVVPSSAPLFLGRRSVVYVESSNKDGETSYSAREVTLGPRAGAVYPVVSGLEAGERVVVHGAFAIDADLQIRGGDSMMMQSDDSSTEPVLAVPKDFRGALAPIITHYLEVQTALADDDLPAARTAGQALAKTADDFAPDAPTDAAELWLGFRGELAQHSKHLDMAEDLPTAREAFRGFSKVVTKILKRFGNPTDIDLKVAFCPMAFENEGAEWIQATDKLDNSYFGASMLTCGEIRETIPATAGGQ